MTLNVSWTGERGNFPVPELRPLTNSGTQETIRSGEEIRNSLEELRGTVEIATEVATNHQKTTNELLEELVKANKGYNTAGGHQNTSDVQFSLVAPYTRGGEAPIGDSISRGKAINPQGIKDALDQVIKQDGLSLNDLGNIEPALSLYLNEITGLIDERDKVASRILTTWENQNGHAIHGSFALSRLGSKIHDYAESSAKDRQSLEDTKTKAAELLEGLKAVFAPEKDQAPSTSEK